MDEPRVGFIGLGAMGSRMAARLVDAGYRVLVHNRTRAREAQLRHRGAESASSPQEVAAAADIIVSCVLHDEAVRQVYLAETGMVNVARAGQVFVEHATFSPALAREVGTALTARGASFVDAPVSGGPEGASAGTLTAMVGGDGVGVAMATPVVRAYAAAVVHVGPTGAGLELKLVNQMLVTCHAAAAAEADELMRRMAIQPETAASVLDASWGSSAMLTRLLQRRLANAGTHSEATIGGLRAPQELVRGLLDQHGLKAAVTSAALDVFADARAAGRDHHDLTELMDVSS